MKRKFKADTSFNVKNLLYKNLQRPEVNLSKNGCKIDTDTIKNLENIITRTALNGESNSALIVGPQGCGKNRILNVVLESLQQNKEVISNLLQIHLNGLLQTDDRISLKEITRQLQLENLTENKTFRSFAENLEFILQSLRTGNRRSKSILFVLDEFDLFCHHKNQTLLYNLFDISQSAQTPICVIGLTCRMDVVEMLEKRVKSRYSHRQIHVFPSYSFEEYVQLAIDFLTVTSINDETKEWNNSVQATFTVQSTLDILKRYFNTTKNIRALKKLLYIVVSLLNDDSSLTPTVLIESFHILSLNSKALILTGLSVLELCLIITMSSLTIKYDGEAFNLQMVYDEYIKFTRSHSTVQSFEFPVITKAFEHLLALELVTPAAGIAGKGAFNYQLMTLLVDRSQVHEAIQNYIGLSTEIHQWAMSALA